MLKLGLAIALLTATPVMAADHTLTLSDQELTAIVDALSVAPYFKAAPVLGKLQHQLQQAAAPKPAKPAEPPTPPKEPPKLPPTPPIAPIAPATPPPAE